MKTWDVTKTPIAHRGLHCEGVPENSLASFEAAIKAGFPIELDVHLLGGQEVVVFHDKDFKRACGVDKKLSQVSLKEIKDYRLWQTDQNIPTLQETLNLVQGKVPLLIELKEDGWNVGPLEQEVLKALRAYKGEVAIQSFNPQTLRWFRAHCPELSLGLLSCDFKLEKNMKPTHKFFLRMMSSFPLIRPNFVGYLWKNLSHPYLRLFRKISGVPFLAWTVKSQEEYQKVRPFCDNIIFEGFNPKD